MSRIFYSPKVPVLQNKVFSDRESAIEAPVGSLNIVKHSVGGYHYNSEFDANKVNYDEDYDNLVPSASFLNYYDELIDYLVDQYNLLNGPVVEIGCGKAVFLDRLIGRHKDFRGIGIDPTYEGELSRRDGRLIFIRDVLRSRYFESDETPSLVVCRHVLEHIPDPLIFLKEIFQSFANHQGIPIYVEVPDLDWIIKHNAFWDFCYEHVNYFDSVSLKNIIESAGGKVQKIGRSFGGQYLTCEAVINSDIEFEPNSDQSKFGSVDGQNFEKSIENISDEILDRIDGFAKDRKTVVWGMATKGVMYSQFLRNAGVKLWHCVDVNQNKQNKFAPVTGSKIESPGVLTAGQKYLIICMNPNYFSEISAQCSSMNLDAILVDPNINLQ